MPIAKLFSNIWASSGDTGTAPTAAKIILGWIKERVKYTRLNWMQNRIETRINSIIENGIGTWYPNAADINKMICSGQWDEPWSMTDDAVNEIDASPTYTQLRDICVYFDSDNNPYLLVLDNFTSKILVYNARTKALVLATDALTNDLPSGGTQNWQQISMCTDGTHVFVLNTDIDATPDTHLVQAWTIDITGSNWTPTWGTTGTALAGTGNGTVSSVRDGKVIVASDDYIAVSCGWVTAAATSSKLIQLFDITDGTDAGFGAGDCTLGSTYYPCEGICSDGTNIFFLAIDTAAVPDVTKVCSATIADLTAGTGGAGYPYTLPSIGGADLTGRELCALGVGGAFVSVHDQAPTSGDSANLIVHNASSANLMQIEIGDLGSAEEGEDYVLTEALDLKYDGMHLWVLCSNNDGTTKQLKLIKIDVAKLNTIAQVDNPWLLDITNSIFNIMPGAAFPAAADDSRKFVGMCFDGRDIWFNVEARTGQTYTGILKRFPMAIMRS